MDLKGVIEKAKLLPPGVGPSVLRDIAQAWQDDPKFLDNLAAHNYETILAAIQKNDQSIMVKLMAFGMHLFT